MKQYFSRYITTFVIFLLAISFPLNALAGVFGVGVYLSGEPDVDKSTVADMMSDLGISITRMTIEYGQESDWTPFDTAVNLTRAKGIENLILLGYRDGVSVNDWGNFVQAVATRYSGKTVGYEIMNEADNGMSGSTYASYLSRSYDKIKENDSGAKVVCSGLTARAEATSFWQGIYDGGAWSKCEAIGLHPYRDVAPETVSFNTGDFVSAVNIAANFINSHGGGKKIWITEFGVKSTSVGDTNQANYLSRSYIMARSVSEVEKMMMYRFRDSDGWGLVNSNLSHKLMWDRYKDVVRDLDYSGTADRVYVYDKNTVDSFDSTSGYTTNGSSNASVSLSNSPGYSGSGLKIDFNFNNSSAYFLAQKEIEMSGSPVGLGIWAKGPSDSNVFKLRIKDKDGETFQFDMGKLTSDWIFYKFDFAHDAAKVSWSGNGNIDYPIKFDSVVFDRQGGGSNGSVYVDELVSINDAADLYAYKLGSKLAYWKVNGSKTTSACGKSLNFTEAPQVTSVGSCTTWESSGSSSSSSSSSSSTTTSDESSGSKVYLSKTNSTISADKDKATANNNDTINFTVTLKDTNGNVTSSSKLKAEVSGSGNTQGELKKDGDNYKMTLKSTKAEEKTVKFTVGSWEMGSKKVTFEPGAYSQPNTQIIPSKWTAAIGDEIDLDLKVRDANDNELANDKKPSDGWTLINVDGGATITQEPNAANSWRAKIRSDVAGKIVLGVNYNNAVLSRQTIIYYNPVLVPIETITADKTITFKKDDKLTIAAKPGDNLAFNLDGMADATKVIVKISSNPTYFWLTKNSTTNQYQGVATIAEELGSHVILVYSENEKGEATEFAKGTLEVAQNATVSVAVKANKIPTWQYIVLGILGVVLLGLIVIFAVPKFRTKVFGWIKSVISKLHKTKLVGVNSNDDKN